MLGGEQLYMQIAAGKQHRWDIILTSTYTFIMSRVSEILQKKNIGLTNYTQ